MRINKFLYITLVLFMFLAAGTLFSQSFEIAGGVDLGWGNAVYENKDGEETSSGLVNVGLGLQIGAMWKKTALLAEGNMSYVFTKDAPNVMWNAGAIFEFYPFVFENGETKLGIGLGGGYGSFLMNSFYARVEIPFIFSGGKIGINGEYYFINNGPAYRVGLMYYLRGEQVLGFFQNQDIIR
jgi:hypothetical protein